ncbi:MULTISPECIES: hypothetical protein [Hyphobacterium]|uniref:Uncharacterized protein n=1 Tax=Hyphobacterium vulgare TaxID=1736751 RepID=A0ABV6ZU48_9PROT
MTDYCLRAETEAALKGALPFAVLAEDETSEGVVIRPAGSWIAHKPGLYALDLIGPLIVEDATFGEPDPETGEAEMLTPPVVDEGFHANLRTIGDFAPEIDPALIVTPSNPRRVWA